MNSRRLRWGLGPMLVGMLAITYGLYFAPSVFQGTITRIGLLAGYLAAATLFAMGALVLTGLWPVDNGKK